ncbi:hypothetical protein GCM10009634_29260 [Saccharothrix xinjiangensis]
MRWNRGRSSWVRVRWVSAMTGSIRRSRVRRDPIQGSPDLVTFGDAALVDARAAVGGPRVVHREVR